MRRIKLVLVVVAVMAMMAASALPATAEPHSEGGPIGPICQWFYTNGDGGYIRPGGVGDWYYENWCGWHQWCQSPVYGWYVLR